MACILLPAMRADGEPTMDAEEREAFCIVERGQRRLALPASAVRRVLSGGTLTPLPCAPPHVVGLVSDRGAPLPVVCVDPWIDEPVRACRSGEPVLVLECGGLRFGVIVDRVGGVGWLPAYDAGTPDPSAPAPVVGAARPADGGPVSLIDPAALASAVVAAADAAFAGDGALRAA
jgi:purine-binding chemotaxis protein CheW